MTISDKVAIWLTSQPDLTQGLSFSERQDLKDGGHSEVASGYIEKMRKQIRWGRLSAGFVGAVLLVVGLVSWAYEFGLIGQSGETPSGLTGGGNLMILGAAAIVILFRVGQWQERVSLFDSAKSVDAFFEGRT